jgi:hypothetical protein
VLAQHGDGPHTVTPAVAALLAHERSRGLGAIEGYLGFRPGVEALKHELLELLIRLRREGRRVVAYGAAAKGNTLLNFCGIREDLVEFAVDRSPHKQGRYLPGTHLAIRGPEAIDETRPDYVLLLPWNLEEELTRQLAGIRAWGGRFIVPIPRVRILE